MILVVEGDLDGLVERVGLWDLGIVGEVHVVGLFGRDRRALLLDVGRVGVALGGHRPQLTDHITSTDVTATATTSATSVPMPAPSQR